jgi:hypothetical protein
VASIGLMLANSGARSGSGTPSISQITTNGSRAATPATKSNDPRSDTSSRIWPTTRRTYGSSATTECGVNALLTSARSFVCRGGSVITSVPAIIW